MSKPFSESTTDMAGMGTSVPDTCVTRSDYSLFLEPSNYPAFITILPFIDQLSNQILETLERTPNGSLTSADIKKALMDSHIRVNENVSVTLVIPIV